MKRGPYISRIALTRPIEGDRYLLDELAGRASQFIIATHSPILMALPGAEIFQLDREGVRAVAYRETEHYQITRRFLENPERMLRCLLEKA